MTERQKKGLYFPNWSATVKANGWRMVSGRLQLGTLDSGLGSELVALGRQRAAALHRGCTVDDLRHAAHVLALGRDKSSTTLTNAELDRVVCLFRLLADPDDLKALTQWSAYQRGEDPGSEKRVDYFLSHAAPAAYAGRIAADQFGTRNVDQLTPAQKRALAITLAHRRQKTSVASFPSVASESSDPDWSIA